MNGAAAEPPAIATRLLAWFDRHGRHDLPWQQSRTPYSVWVSEIMLQQTQVGTVIPYFERFMRRFPNVAALAAAPLDAVVEHWAGLGYYARARNLKRAAELVVERHGGEIPGTLEALMALPGIGRSTAGAVLAQSRGERHPILDGNVRRVLARYHAVPGWPGTPEVERQLWAHAERHMPHDRVADYTQAIMDLGATLCVRSRPACTVCPLVADCRAAHAGEQASFPAPRPKRARPRRSQVVLVIAEPSGRVLLERRPARGIWGGLHSFPELPPETSAAEWCAGRFASSVAREAALPVIEHAFTHFDLTLQPLSVQLGAAPARVMDGEGWLWYNPSEELRVGVPAPIAALLRTLRAAARDTATV